MSVDSLQQFTDQLRDLPLETPPVSLLIDAQLTIQRRRTFRRRLTQVSVVACLCVLGIWVVVDQSTLNVTSDRVVQTDTSNTEMKYGEESSEITGQSPTATLTASAIILSVVEIDKQLEQLDEQEDARRQVLLASRAALKQSYVEVRNQPKNSLFRRVALYN